MAVERGSDLYRALELLTRVALEAPLRDESREGRTALIPWTTVKAIRAELDAAGIPWRRHHRQAKP